MRSKNKLLYGVGLNDSRLPVRKYVDGKTVFFCPIYKTWSNMLKRAYCEKYQGKHPTYKDVTVCKEWLLFSNFRDWMIEKEWEGKDLDKDILFIGNREYSPDRCCFVSSGINSLLLDNKHRKGDYPTGVDYVKRNGKFRARCNFAGREETVGYYDNPESAEREYKKFKAKIIRITALEIDDISIRCGLFRHANKIQEAS
jgi:hypothetical protein